MDQQRAEALADASALFVGAGSRRSFRSQRRTVIGVVLFLASLALSLSNVRSVSEGKSHDLLWIVIDVGPTMRTRDLPGGRLEFAKSVATQLIERWRGRVRVSTIGDSDIIVTPATSDSRRALQATTALASRSTFPRLRSASAVVEPPQHEAFLGVVFSDGNNLDVRRWSPNNERGNRWIVVGLGDESHASPIPDDKNGWVMQRGRNMESKRNEANLTELAAALNGAYWPAKPEARSAMERILATTNALHGDPRAQSNSLGIAVWLAIGGFVASLSPWRWIVLRPRSAATAMLLTATTVVNAQNFSAARGLLVEGRWRDAEVAFKRLIPSDAENPRLHWGLGVAATGRADETSDPVERRRLIGEAIEAFHRAEVYDSDPDDREDLRWNIAVAKRNLKVDKKPQERDAEAPTTTTKSKTVRSSDSANGSQSDPNAERKSGTEVGGGSVERPVAGLSTLDPGKMDRAAAASIIQGVAASAEGSPARNRMPGAPKRR